MDIIWKYLQQKKGYIHSGYRLCKTHPFEYSLPSDLHYEIQIEYETFARWGELTDGKGEKGEVDIKALIFGIKAMLNEAIDIENETLTDNKKPYLTEKQVGRLITEMGLKEATQKLNSTVINSTKDDKPKNE